MSRKADNDSVRINATFCLKCCILILYFVQKRAHDNDGDAGISIHPHRCHVPFYAILFSLWSQLKPDKIYLSKEFFESTDIDDIEVKATVISESDKAYIINQYIILIKVLNEQTKQHGITQKAVTEIICICKYTNILREYLLVI